MKKIAKLFVLGLVVLLIPVAVCAQQAVDTKPTAVDLGLSVKWANVNVGANAPEEYGDYFAWGETNTKSAYSWKTYKWCKVYNDELTKYCIESKYGSDDFTDNKTVLDPEDDVATQLWGEGWRMPTMDEIKELQDNCDWKWTSINGKDGYTVKSEKNGNSIFLPAAGYRYHSSIENEGTDAFYWSSSLGTYTSDYAYHLNFYSGGVAGNYTDRDCGQSVRAVRE